LDGPIGFADREAWRTVVNEAINPPRVVEPAEDEEESRSSCITYSFHVTAMLNNAFNPAVHKFPD
jgi:hypothetical protein